MENNLFKGNLRINKSWIPAFAGMTYTHPSPFFTYANASVDTARDKRLIESFKSLPVTAREVTWFDLLERLNEIK